MYIKNIISSIILIIFSIFLIFESKKLTIIENSVPGPGAFPYILGIILLILSCILIIKTFLLDKDKNEKNYINKNKVGNILLIISIIILSFLYYYLFGKMNFIVLTSLFFLIFILVLKKRTSQVINIKVVINRFLLSILLATIIYGIFGVFLSVPL
jgi:hypothetical protein